MSIDVGELCAYLVKPNENEIHALLFKYIDIILCVHYGQTNKLRLLIMDGQMVKSLL
jgi:hypothetical protein